MNSEKTNEVKEIKNNRIIEFEKNVSDSVTNRVNQLTKEGRLNLPANYSVGNAMASAWLILQGTVDKDKRPVLEVCTRESIANALLDMAIMGLNPAKKQGYFIAYGKQLSWFTSYFGKCAALKRIKGIAIEPIGTLIYEGDEVQLGINERGEEIVTHHNITWASKLKGNITGAYATVKQGDIIRSVVMTIEDIKESWKKSKTNIEHKEFTGEYCKRTVINRLVKMILQTSNDDDLLAEVVINNENQHYNFEETEVIEETKKEIETNANTGEVISFKEESEIVETASSENLKTEEDPGY